MPCQTFKLKLAVFICLVFFRTKFNYKENNLTDGFYMLCQLTMIYNNIFYLIAPFMALMVTLHQQQKHQ